MAEDADPELISEVEASGLFDAAWYLAQHKDVAGAGLDPLVHFVRHGLAEGRWPSRYVDPAWYLREHPDVAEAGIDPVLHFMRYGDLEGRRPHPFVDAGWYRFAYQLPDGAHALRHYMEHRFTGRYVPGPELFAVPFLSPYDADPAAGVDPVGHYLDDMENARVEVFPDLPVVVGSRLIDPNYYLINASDVHEAQLDPAVHYCRFGWKEHRRPNIYFDIGWYLETNPDLQRLRVNPLVHYLVSGEPRGRRPVPYFDPVWYAQTYAVPAGRSPLAHFLEHRRSQTVSPTPLFDVAWYVEQHREELGANRDPFAHYLQIGTTRDIDPSPAFNAAGYRRRHLGRPSRMFRHMLQPERDNPLVHYLRSDYL